MPIPLRTVRPFILEEICLTDVQEEEGLDLSDQMEISKFLKGRVSTSLCVALNLSLIVCLIQGE